MINNNDIITAVQSKYLFDTNEKNFNGFSSAISSDSSYKSNFRKSIVNHYESMTHKDAFKDENYKEIIACFFIVNSNTGLVSAYRNAPSDKKGVDPSLGIWSCGYKGHVKSIDAAIKEQAPIDPILLTRYNDLSNDIQLMNGTMDVKKAKLIGYINNNSDHNKLSQTHFTLVYGLLTDSTEIINPAANLNKNLSLGQLDKIIKSAGADYWTAESFPALCKYVNDLELDSH